ncbi:uracil-DNA glycosylase [Silvibacterium acidisoli]|uniref:uracil-DNA glycosylase n=1 Tax=Acidobacteriaceae bacterium ZG23-2 TaxID=2883246 RepID=UPI00406C2732
MAQLDPELAEAVRARLRYYRDLGVYDFYRNGEPDSLQLPEAASIVEPEKETVTVTKIAASAEPVPVNLPEPEMPPRKPISPALSMPVPAEMIPAADKPAALEAIRAEIGECTRCPLAFLGRHKIVFGDGTPNAKLMFVGEGPGADEDAQGLPFVGKAGQLLNNMINAMGLKREEVYIANIVKCRPPQNRVPEPEEANTCSPFLFRQIDVIRPEIIVALGSTAATYLLGRKSSLSSLRGHMHEARGSKLIVTYHPAYLLRDPTQKKEAWKDLQIAMKELGLKPAAKG